MTARIKGFSFSSKFGSFRSKFPFSIKSSTLSRSPDSIASLMTDSFGLHSWIIIKKFIYSFNHLQKHLHSNYRYCFSNAQFLHLFSEAHRHRKAHRFQIQAHLKYHQWGLFCAWLFISNSSKSYFKISNLSISCAFVFWIPAFVSVLFGRKIRILVHRRLHPLSLDEGISLVK